MAMVLPSPLVAQDGDARVAEPPPADTHTVERNETLVDLAREYFGDPGAWERIFEANRDRIDDPDRIREGQRLVIPGEEDRDDPPEPTPEPDEEPAVVQAIRTADGPADTARGPEEGSEAEDPDDIDRTRAHRTRSFEAASSGSFPEGRTRTVFYYRDLGQRPEPEVVGAEAERWSEVTGGAWAGAPWLTTEGDHPARVGVLSEFAGGEEHQAVGRVAIHQYDRLRVATKPDHELSQGDRLLAYRVEPVSTGTLLRAGEADSEDEVPAPAQVRPTGVLEVERIEGAGVVARVTREFRAMRLFDRVAPYTEVASEPGVHPVRVDPAEALEGELVGFEEERQLVQRGDRGYIDLGAEDGVKPGDVFAALGGKEDGSGWSARDVARLQVVRVEEGSSVVRVEQVHAAIRDGGLPVRQVRRMP